MGAPYGGPDNGPGSQPATSNPQTWSTPAPFSSAPNWTPGPAAAQGPYDLPPQPYAPYGTYAPPPMHPYAGRPGYVTDQAGKNVQAIIAWVLTVLTVGYMLPWAIAATRGKSNAGMIGIVNLLLGWTVVGWVVALVMACGAHQIAGTQQVTVVTGIATSVNFPPSYGPPPGYAEPSAYSQPPYAGPPAPPARYAPPGQR